MGASSPASLPNFYAASRGQVAPSPTPSQQAAQAAGSERKTFVLDTSVLLHDPDVLSSFEENTVCVPLCVVDDLNHFKKSAGAVGANARAAIRLLDALRQEGDLAHGVYNKETGGLVRILTHSSGLSEEGERILPAMGDPVHATSGDRVLRFALSLTKAAKRIGGHGRVILVSKDMVVRLKANALRLEVDDFLKQAVRNDSELQGYVELEAQPEEVSAVQNLLEELDLCQGRRQAQPTAHEASGHGPTDDTPDEALAAAVVPQMPPFDGDRLDGGAAGLEPDGAAVIDADGLGSLKPEQPTVESGVRGGTQLPQPLEKMPSGLSREQEKSLMLRVGDWMVANSFVVLSDRQTPARSALLRGVPRDMEAEAQERSAEYGASDSSKNSHEPDSERFRRYAIELKPVPCERNVWNIASRSLQQVWKRRGLWMGLT
jgi:PhoH-like ATPase